LTASAATSPNSSATTPSHNSVPSGTRTSTPSGATFAEREEIALARARGETIGSIARRLGRAPSTISRELGRNTDRRDGRYRASTAHALAYGRASRPKPAKLAVNVALRERVQDDLLKRLTPEQIAGRLRRRYPDEHPAARRDPARSLLAIRADLLGCVADERAALQRGPEQLKRLGVHPIDKTTLEFLRVQAAQARAEQNRYLERAADRAYLAMHAPIAPLLAVLVLLFAYGLHFLATTI
jgi:hypothetical protein